MKRTTVFYVLVVSLGTQVLVGFAFGLRSLVDPEGFLDGLGAEIYDESLDSVALVVGMLLCLAGGVSLLSIIWISRGNVAGSITGVLVGIQVFAVGTLSFLLLDDSATLLFDGPRGAAMVVGGVLTYRTSLEEKASNS